MNSAAHNPGPSLVLRRSGGTVAWCAVLLLASADGLAQTAPTPYERGRTLQQAGQHREALEAFSQAYAQTPPEHRPSLARHAVRSAAPLKDRKLFCTWVARSGGALPQEERLDLLRDHFGQRDPCAPKPLAPPPPPPPPASDKPVVGPQPPPRHVPITPVVGPTPPPGPAPINSAVGPQPPPGLATVGPSMPTPQPEPVVVTPAPPPAPPSGPAPAPLLPVAPAAAPQPAAPLATTAPATHPSAVAVAAPGAGTSALPTWLPLPPTPTPATITSLSPARPEQPPDGWRGSVGLTMGSGLLVSQQYTCQDCGWPGGSLRLQHPVLELGGWQRLVGPLALGAAVAAWLGDATALELRPGLRLLLAGADDRGRPLITLRLEPRLLLLPDQAVGLRLGGGLALPLGDRLHFSLGLAGSLWPTQGWLVSFEGDAGLGFRW